MQKKALVFAVAAALMVPCAFAQKKGEKSESEADNIVELYGKLYPELVRQYGKGATPLGTSLATFAGVCSATAPVGGCSGTNAVVTRTEMESSNSRFGVRGQEKLGGGLKAI